jgi:hypothetical protein
MIVCRMLGGDAGLRVGFTLGSPGPRGLRGPRAPQELVIPVQGGTNFTDAALPFFTYVCGPVARNFAADLCRGHARIAAHADTALRVFVNGVQVATLTFRAGHTDAPIQSADIALVEGDVLEVFGPATPDPALLNPATILVEDI